MILLSMSALPMHERGIVRLMMNMAWDLHTV